MPVSPLEMSFLPKVSARLPARTQRFLGKLKTSHYFPYSDSFRHLPTTSVFDSFESKGDCHSIDDFDNVVLPRDSWRDCYASVLLLANQRS